VEVVLLLRSAIVAIVVVGVEHWEEQRGVRRTRPISEVEGNLTCVSDSREREGK
jgi:hypothetical protein